MAGFGFLLKVDLVIVNLLVTVIAIMMTDSLLQLVQLVVIILGSVWHTQKLPA